MQGDFPRPEILAALQRILHNAILLCAPPRSRTRFFSYVNYASGSGSGVWPTYSTVEACGADSKLAGGVANDCLASRYV